jgi:diadenylate cyclase
VAILLLVTWLSELLQFSTLNWLLQQVLSTGAILLVVLFQPELRRALEFIGRSSLKHFISAGSRQRVSVEGTINEIITALSNLSRRRVGALIVFEVRTELIDIIASGTVLDASISAPLIENIFEPNTPLHDGAMVVRGNRIAAAGCILQLSDDTTISRELGTRHRAALGVSESTDTITLIVSEETGIISMARAGKLTRYLDAKTLTIILSELYNRQQETFLDFVKRFREVSNEK